MPFALVFVGLLLIVTGVKGTQKEFGDQVISDFTGPGNFFYWIGSLGAMGALGYIPAMRKFSITFMTLILISMLLANERNAGTTGGFFAMLSKAFQEGPTSPSSGADNATSGGGNMSGLPAIDNSLLLPGTQVDNNAAENFGKVAEVAKMFFF